MSAEVVSLFKPTLKDENGEPRSVREHRECAQILSTRFAEEFGLSPDVAETLRSEAEQILLHGYEPVKTAEYQRIYELVLRLAEEREARKPQA